MEFFEGQFHLTFCKFLPEGAYSLHLGSRPACVGHAFPAFADFQGAGAVERCLSSQRFELFRAKGVRLIIRH